MADRVDERTSQSAAGCGRSGRNDQTDGCSRRFCLGSLAKQKDRPSGQLRAPMQPPCGCQIEPSGIAKQLQKNGRKFPQSGSFFGDPECIHKFRCLRDEKLVQRKPGKCSHTERMGKPHFDKSLADADPENGTSFLFSFGFMVLQNQSGQSQGKSCDGTCVANFAAMDFGQRGTRQAAA